MSKYVVDKKTLTDIADAIRRRKVSDVGIKAEDFAAEIDEIGKKEIMSMIDRSITAIEIPEGVTSIGGYAFYNTALTGVIIPDGVTKIENGAFQDCVSLEKIDIPGSVSSMSFEVFRGCKKLKNVSFAEGSSLKQVPNYAFYGCESLSEIKLPSTVNHIGSYAFAGCSACLRYDLSALQEIPSTYTKPFEGINENARILVPSGSYDSWTKDPTWASLSEYIAELLKLKLSDDSDELRITPDVFGPIFPQGYYNTEPKSFIKLENGTVYEMTPNDYGYGRVIFRTYYEENGSRMWDWCFGSDGSACYIGKGIHEIWVEADGKTVYRRIVEVAGR